MLQSADCIFDSLSEAWVIFSFQLYRSAEGDLHATWPRPPGAPMQDFFYPSQPHGNDRYAETAGDQADAVLKRLDLSGLRAFPLRKEQYRPVVTN